MSKQSDRILRMVGESEDAGAEVLNDARNFIRRFCAFPNEHCLNAVTLWAAHSHAIEHVYSSPRLALLSPEPGSGKTRVLEILNLLVSEPQSIFNASAATIFRGLESKQYTLLFDEVDAIWNHRGKDDSYEDLRALLNAGYRRGATIPRCVGPKHEVVHFKVYAAVAAAGLGFLPETIMTRSIVIRMRPRAPNERIEQYRFRTIDSQGHAIRDRLASWATKIGDELEIYIPQLPPGIVDRPAEVWEPLIALADMAGGEWPQVARAACTALCDEAKDRRASLGIRLLGDVRTLFGDADAIHSRDLVDRLVNDHERTDPKLAADAPWSELYGKPINQRRLASMLGKYGVHPAKVRVGPQVLQGYRREDLYDAWSRYLPAEAEQAEQPEQANSDVASSRSGCVPGVPDGTTSGTEVEQKAPLIPRPVPGVPDVPEFRGVERGITL